MHIVERRQVRAICERVLKVAEATKGTANKEVVQQSVVRLRAALRRGQFREAEDLAYGILTECQSFSEENSEEAAEGHDTSKAPTLSVRNAVNIGRSIKFIRVAAGIKQGEMADRLEISQNYLSLLENNKAEPSLTLLKKISSVFNVPLSFLLLEDSVEFESENPEVDALLKELQQLIHQLQGERVKKGEMAANGAGQSEQ
ncbi:MAG: helix-turn-helix transcriptional regulator [Planctomycetes bacterium]|nr:helix-turn-helix transcriptional regulator [Planctomycetota bacterium]